MDSTKITLVFAIALVASSYSTLAESALTIANDAVSVSVDDASHVFTLTDIASGKTFVKNGALDNAGEVLGVKPVSDNVFGEGRRISIVRRAGGEIGLEVYPHLPFVLVRSSIANGGKEVLDISQTVPAVFTLDLGKRPQEINVLGTGQLAAADKPQGSYLYLAAAIPENRNGVVTGWLTQDRGCGVVFSSPNKSKVAVEIKAQIDYGHLRIAAGKSATLETLAIGYFSDARLGLEAWADAVKKQYAIHLRAPDAVYCTWYDEKYRGAGTDASTRTLSKFVAKELKDFGLHVIQLDDEWQMPLNPRKYTVKTGPQRGFDKVNPKGPYPDGLAPVAKALADDGITFGLWWLPFGRLPSDEEYKDRQHWFAKTTDGAIMDTLWGGACLDLTHPEVKDHLASLSKLYKSWGVTYFKMDGLYTGLGVQTMYVATAYRNDHMGNTAPLHDPFKTQVEAYRDGLKLIRENAGDDVFFSGCNLAQNMRTLCSMGLVDSMRVGPDFKTFKTGPMPGTQMYFLNGRVWWNDTDPCKVSGRIPLETARLNTSWVSLSGSFYLLSNWLPALPPESLDIVKRTIAHHNGTARPVDIFEHVLANTWLITDDQSGAHRDVVAVYNFEKEPLAVEYSFEKIGLDASKSYYAFDYWENKALPEMSKTFKADCAGLACRVIALRAKEGHPLVVSTSRHVSSGILEIKQEQWQGNVLSGVSQVIGNDPYELRIMGLNEGGKSWQGAEARVSEADKAAGVTVKQKQENGLLRVTITAPVGRGVKWQVGFKVN